MKKPFLITCAVVAALTLASLLVWRNVLNFGMPEGWVRYESEELGVTLWHPQEMMPEIFFGDQETGVVLLLEDSVYFSVTRSVEQFDHLETAAFKRTIQGVQETVFAEQEAYQYEEANNVGIGSSNIQTILVSPSENELLEISYVVDEANNQEPQQIADHMLASLELVQRRISIFAIIFGSAIVAGIAIGTGLLFISRPGQ